jgi:hypothetical protein
LFTFAVTSVHDLWNLNQGCNIIFVTAQVTNNNFRVNIFTKYFICQLHLIVYRLHWILSAMVAPEISRRRGYVPRRGAMQISSWLSVRYILTYFIYLIYTIAATPTNVYDRTYYLLCRPFKNWWLRNLHFKFQPANGHTQYGLYDLRRR